jgi:hypothetical protein
VIRWGPETPSGGASLQPFDPDGEVLKKPLLSLEALRHLAADGRKLPGGAISMGGKAFGNELDVVEILFPHHFHPGKPGLDGVEALVDGLESPVDSVESPPEELH